MALHFLYLTNTRLVSVTTSGKRISMRREFAVSGAGMAEFERHLAGATKVPMHLFIDLSEEDFRLDTIPHVGARDREALVARKLSQIFRSTPFRHALLQGRESEGRRDDRVIYTAVTNPEALRPWLDAIERQEVPLAGIHSAAVFSAVMLEELDLVFPHTLLVTFTPGGGMRQTYFRDREIKFSRLTPVDLQPGQSLGAMVAEETTRTWQYLDSLRHFGGDDRLEVCIVIHPSEREALQSELRDFAQIQYRVLDIEQVAAKLGLKPPPLGSTSEEVLIHLFLIRPGENHYASPELRRFASLRRARILIEQAALAVLLAAVAGGGYNLSQVFDASEIDQRVSQQLAAQNREYDEIMRSLPSYGVGGSTVRDAVAFYNGSIRAFPSVGDFLRNLSEPLQAHPEMRVTGIAWMASDDLKATPVIAAGEGRPSLPVRAVSKSAEPAAAATTPEEAANPIFAGGRYEIAVLQATVMVPNNDFRTALEYAERLAAELSGIPGVHAEFMESPLDLRSTLSLQGRLGEKEPPMMQPRFTLRIVRDKAAGA